MGAGGTGRKFPILLCLHFMTGIYLSIYIYMMKISQSSRSLHFYPWHLYCRILQQCIITPNKHLSRANWKKHKLESRLLGEISITSHMQMTPPLWQKVKGNKNLLDESERGEWKCWLKAQHSENEDHGIRYHHFMANRWRNSGNSVRFYLGGGSPKSLQMVIAAMKLKDAYSLEEKLWPT